MYKFLNQKYNRNENKRENESSRDKASAVTERNHVEK